MWCVAVRTFDFRRPWAFLYALRLCSSLFMVSNDCWSLCFLASCSRASSLQEGGGVLVVEWKSAGTGWE